MLSHRYGTCIDLFLLIYILCDSVGTFQKNRSSWGSPCVRWRSSRGLFKPGGPAIRPLDWPGSGSHLWGLPFMGPSHNNCSLAGCYGEWRAPASVTSPVWRNPIHRNPFLIINQIHKYTQMTHTFFVTYECTKLLCVSLTRFYLDSFSFKENTYPVLNQRHISVDIRMAPFLPGPITRDRVFQNRSFHSERPAAYCRKSHSCYRHQGQFFR